MRITGPRGLNGLIGAAAVACLVGVAVLCSWVFTNPREVVKLRGSRAACLVRY